MPCECQRANGLGVPNSSEIIQPAGTVRLSG